MFRMMSACPVAVAVAAAISSPAFAQSQVIYSPWIKIIGPLQPGSAQKLINTSSSASKESGEPVGTAMVLELEGTPQKLFRIVMPDGMDTAGPRIALDGGKPDQKPFVCTQGACFADFELTADLLAGLKTSKNLTVEAKKTGGQPSKFSLPLATFASIYDGLPVDMKTIQAQQEELQRRLQEKADAVRKKLESESKPK